MKKGALTNDDKLKEKIKFNTEVIRLTVVGILTIGGGTVSLTEQGIFTGKKDFLIASGFILVIALTGFLYRSLKNINKTIK